MSWFWFNLIVLYQKCIVQKSFCPNCGDIEMKRFATNFIYMSNPVAQDTIIFLWLKQNLLITYIMLLTTRIKEGRVVYFGVEQRPG